MDKQTTKKMIAMYDSGKSLREVGFAFGLSGERVRQILDASGHRRRPRGFQVGPSASQKQAIADAYLTGASRRELADQYDLSLAEIGRILRGNLSAEDVRDRNRKQATGRKVTRDYADWELVEALTACAADLGPKFSKEDYVEWRSNQDDEYPSLPLFNQRRPEYAPHTPASWNGWRKIAGLPVSPDSTELGHSRQYDAGDIYNALDAVAATVGTFPTVAEYEVNRPKGAPSANTVRLRYGRWGDVRAFYEDWKGAAA